MVVNIGGKINLGATVPSIDNKYGPYLSILDAWDTLGPDGDDVACIGLTVGIQSSPNSPVVEYWFKEKAESKEDLVVKFVDSSYHDATKQDVLTQQDKQAIADLKDISGKVDKVEGSSLMTSAEHTKLAGIEQGANKYVLPTDVVHDSNYVHTDNNLTSELMSIYANKQDAIADLSEIREGASKGATAIQEHQSLAAYRTAADQDAIHDDTKQDVISDLETIRSGASLGATAIQDATYVHTDSNYTADEKSKLAGIENNANNYTHPASHPASMITDLATVAKSGNYDDLSNKPSVVLKSEKGSANGVASLDGSGKVPAAQLPSYVDDVVEYNTRSDFPIVGESGKVYIAADTNITYRWSGNMSTGYVVIGSDLALGETSSTAYPGDKGKKNATDIDTHIKDTDCHVSVLEKTTWGSKYDKPAAGIPASDLDANVQVSLQNANTAVADLQTKVDKETGYSLMSTDEHTKLASISSGANKVEASSTNGRIKIDGVETNVYTEPTGTVHDSNYKHVTVTTTSVSDGTNTFNKYVLDSKYSGTVNAAKDITVNKIYAPSSQGSAVYSYGKKNQLLMAYEDGTVYWTNEYNVGPGLAKTGNYIFETYAIKDVLIDNWESITETRVVEEVEEEVEIYAKYDLVVNGVTSKSNPVLDIFISKDDYDKTDLINEAWSKIYSAETTDGHILLYATEKPEVDLSIQIKGY